MNQNFQKLKLIMRSSGMEMFEYFPDNDRLILYNSVFQITDTLENCLTNLGNDAKIHPEDRWKVKEFFIGRLSGPLEIRVFDEDGYLVRKTLQGFSFSPSDGSRDSFIGSIKDVTGEKIREQKLAEQAQRDSLTKLYNQSFGKELINEYLSHKNPFDACGIIVMDIDYFKQVNDIYGHLFGDRVLERVGSLLSGLFEPKDILIRSGGDEFVILVKEIKHNTLVKIMIRLVKRIRNLTFEENDCRITCSAGVCYLPENFTGYSYDQLFENADWALYQAKLSGRNGYAFCDNLQRFQFLHGRLDPLPSNVDARYLQNDIIATAFEIFEKMSNFDTAIHLLLEVVGIRFSLDRITVINNNIRNCSTSSLYQWRSEHAPEMQENSGIFTKEDFLTLFHSYDEYGTAVLDYDNMELYSPEASAFLMQGDAKTVVYAAMYCQGKYTGTISYAVCDCKRRWSKQSRSQLGELTKIISAHLAQHTTINAPQNGILAAPEYDSLTGLISFSRFRDELEQKILGGNAVSHAVVYTDFENFKYFNQTYGFHMGDQLLKSFSNFISEMMDDELDILFSRIVADQFILFRPLADFSHLEEKVSRINERFVQTVSDQYPEAHMRLRSGIYLISPSCVSASDAIDAANFARKSLNSTQTCSACLYNDALAARQHLENEVITGIDRALAEHQFQVYLQPKFSLEDNTLVGAEALVRWKREDGTLIFPDAFIPLYEKNGRIIDLDFYVFEGVAEFLAKNKRLGRKQVPISVNASILHTTNADTVSRYLQILEQYGVDPSLTEIELTETATVTDYENVKKLFQSLRNAGFHTSLDDFGAGYSVLNTIIDVPIDTLKFDRYFISSCVNTSKGRYFLRQMISLMQGLGYQIVCEGVETQEQADLLLQAGCRTGQGYLFSRPLPIEEYEKRFYSEH